MEIPAPGPGEANKGPMPRLEGFDQTLELLRDPYRFIGRNCGELNSDAFEARLLGARTICMSGPEAAELFYDEQRFQRGGAAPELLRATLFGKGAVQALDDAPHRRRKGLFLALRAPRQLALLDAHVRRRWDEAMVHWAARGRFRFYDALHPLLTRAACDWVGVPLETRELDHRARQLTRLFDAAAAFPARHLAARAARWQAERWLANWVADCRAHRAVAPPDSLAEAVIEHRDEDGRLLSPRIAAVELLNLLRPTVAVSVFIVFVAHALQRAPEWRSRLAQRTDIASGTEGLAFVQEVRRHYPFFPAVVARVRRTFDWRGMRFEGGLRALLDLYGTNHDPRAWDDEWDFQPERWLRQRPGPYQFVPQGGGEAAVHHRCPGEDVATRLMLVALERLVAGMSYRVPPQTLDLDMARLPALPRDGFLIEDVRPAGNASR